MKISFFWNKLKLVLSLKRLVLWLNFRNNYSNIITCFFKLNYVFSWYLFANKIAFLKNLSLLKRYFCQAKYIHKPRWSNRCSRWSNHHRWSNHRPRWSNHRPRWSNHRPRWSNHRRWSNNPLWPNHHRWSKLNQRLSNQPLWLKNRRRWNRRLKG